MRFSFSFHKAPWCRFLFRRKSISVIFRHGLKQQHAHGIIVQSGSAYGPRAVGGTAWFQHEIQSKWEERNLFCEARPRTSHLHRHNRKTTPRPWNLGRRVMAYTFGNGNGTQRQQNNIPIQERNGHRGWGWINPAFFVWVAYTSWIAFQCAVGVFRGLLLNCQKI